MRLILSRSRLGLIRHFMSFRFRSTDWSASLRIVSVYDTKVSIKKDGVLPLRIQVLCEVDEATCQFTGWITLPAGHLRHVFGRTLRLCSRCLYIIRLQSQHCAFVLTATEMRLHVTVSQYLDLIESPPSFYKYQKVSQHPSGCILIV